MKYTALQPLQGSSKYQLENGLENRRSIDGKCVSNIRENQTNLADLNDDCKMLIFEQMEFNDLISMSEINHHFSALATDVFRQKFASKEIEVRQSLDDESLESDDNIQIGSLDEATKLFRHFGSLITRLKINYGTNDDCHAKEVISLANLHCDTLRHLKINSFDENALEGVQKPFQTVEDLSMHGKFGKLGSDTLQLNEMFPRMRRWSVNYLRVSEEESMTLEFPNLEHFSVSFIEFLGISEEVINDVIELNPQIQSISAESSSIEFVQFLSEHLSNLEHLELIWNNAQEIEFNGVISFKTVRSFNLTSLFGDFLGHIHFAQLEELKATHCSDYIDMLAIFMEKHSNLTKLNILEDELSDSQLKILIGKIPNLSEASLFVGPDVSANTLIQLVSESIKLKQLNFSWQERPSYKVINELQSELLNEWNISKGLFEFNITKDY